MCKNGKTQYRKNRSRSVGNGCDSGFTVLLGAFRSWPRNPGSIQQQLVECPYSRETTDPDFRQYFFLLAAYLQDYFASSSVFPE